MKTAIITLTAFLFTAAATVLLASQPKAAAPRPAETHGYCYQKMVCGPVGGCQWIWVCN